MPYLSQLLGTPVIDSTGEKIGSVNDLGASLADVFPRVTSLAFQGPSKTPFMISWRKYVSSYSTDEIVLNCPQSDVRFSYLQPSELLLRRDLLNHQVVDTNTTKVVRASDLRLSPTNDGQLRLLGIEVGARGVLRGVSPKLETVATKVAKTLGRPIPDRFVAWGNIDLPGADLSQYRGANMHRSIEDMHPADIADIVEQLDPELRGQVLRQLDPDSAAETISELGDEVQTSVIEGMNEHEAAEVIAQMDPDDAADIVGELPFERAEKILDLMDPANEKAIRTLLGYSKNSAGGNMTSEFVAMPQTSTFADLRRRLRALPDDFEPTYYVYTLDDDRRLVGVLSMRDVLNASAEEKLADHSFDDLVKVSPEDDQAFVAEEMTKYGLVSMPVVDEGGRLIGVVSVDDVLHVIEEGQDRDRDLASGTRSGAVSERGGHLTWFLRRELWFLVWIVVVAAASHVLPHQVALPFMAFLPVVLLVADDVLSFAAGYLIDSEEERPSLSSLLARDLVVGLVLGFLGWLAVSVALWSGSLPFDLSMHAIGSTLVAAMVTVVLSVTLAACATVWMARRAEHDKATPGVSVSIVIMLSAAVVFAVLAVALA